MVQLDTNTTWQSRTLLVNNVLEETYVSEQDLTADSSDEQINHPLVGAYFDEFNNGRYKNTTWRPN